MKKSIATTATVATILASSSLVANADEVTQTTATDSSVENVVATKEDKTVTETEVITAKVIANQSQSDVDTQQKVVDTSKKEVEEASNKVVSAEAKVVEAQNTLNQATPENIEKAETTVQETERALNNAEAHVNTSNNEVNQAKNLVDSQQQVVAEAQSEVTKAQSDVETKQAILDGTGASEVIAKANQAQVTQEADQQVVSKATEELAQAQKSDNQRQASINQANTNVSEANNKVSTKTNGLTTATSQLENAKENLSQTTTAYNSAKNDYDSINTFVLTPEYIKYLKQQKDSLFGTAQYKEAVSKLKEINDGVKTLNNYKANANDSQKKLETNNLSEADRLELTLFAQDLINQIRKQVGTAPVTVTKQAVDFADKIASAYVEDNWTWEDVKAKGHDINALTRVATSMDLASGGNKYEDMNSYSIAMPTITMGEAKELIYKSIRDFMFNGWEWLHAESIAGLINTDSTYFGLDLSSRSNVSGVHFLTISSRYIKGSFDKQPITNSKNSETIIATYNKTKADNDSAITAYNKANLTFATAQEELKQAQVELQKAEQSLVTAKSVKELTPEAQSKLDTAKKKLSQSTAENQKAQQAVKELNADIQTKTKALNNAKAILSQKTAVLSAEKNKLDKLQGELEKAHRELANAQNELAMATQNLVNAKSTYESLVNAPKKLEEAKQELLEAQTLLAESKARADEEQDKLAELKAIRDEKLANYQTLKSKFEAQQEELRLKELESKRQSLQSQGLVVTPVFNETGKIVDYVSGSVGHTASGSPKLTAYRRETGESAKTGKSSLFNNLPKTGDKGTIVSVFVGFVLIALGLNTRKRKEK